MMDEHPHVAAVLFFIICVVVFAAMLMFAYKYTNQEVGGIISLPAW